MTAYVEIRQFDTWRSPVGSGLFDIRAPNLNILFVLHIAFIRGIVISELLSSTPVIRSERIDLTYDRLTGPVSAMYKTLDGEHPACHPAILVSKSDLRGR